MMFQVMTTSSEGTRYPIAFFAHREDAEQFVERGKGKWKHIYYAPCESAEMLFTLVPEDKWRIK